jgi:uncharacterized protein YbaR (Trm112 family)
VDRDLESSLESFVCPRCKGGLAIDAGAVRCEVCRLLYPIVDGIPVLVIDEARPLPAGEEVGLKSG